MSTTPPAAPTSPATVQPPKAVAKKSGKKLIDEVHIVHNGKSAGITVFANRPDALELAILEKADVTAVKFGETVVLD